MQFLNWLEEVDQILANNDMSRDKLPYYAHQWWELWDHDLDPSSAVVSALLLCPDMTLPWPDHYIYSRKIKHIYKYADTNVEVQGLMDEIYKRLESPK